MKVYALNHHYYNYCDEWITLVRLYLKEDDAIMEQIKLEQKRTNSEKETDSWSVRELDVI